MWRKKTQALFCMNGNFFFFFFTFTSLSYQRHNRRTQKSLCASAPAQRESSGISVLFIFLFYFFTNANTFDATPIRATTASENSRIRTGISRHCRSQRRTVLQNSASKHRVASKRVRASVVADVVSDRYVGTSALVGTFCPDAVRQCKYGARPLSSIVHFSHDPKKNCKIPFRSTNKHHFSPLPVFLRAYFSMVI